MKNALGKATAVGTLVLTGLRPAPASAQTVGLGYGFAAPGLATCCGDLTTMLHAGGGEAILGNGIGIGADAGYLGPLQAWSEGFGLLSVNGSYHFSWVGPRHRTRPFVTSGYSLAFRGGDHLSLWNIGGGADYWITPRVGLRIEARDHFRSEQRGTSQLWGPRFGIVIRNR